MFVGGGNLVQGFPESLQRVVPSRFCAVLSLGARSYSLIPRMNAKVLGEGVQYSRQVMFSDVGLKLHFGLT